MASNSRQRAGHVIVCGLHGVGLRTVEQLHLAGVPVVVVDDDPDPRLTRTVSGWGVPHVRGSSRATETLLDAGLEGATAVVCVEPDDLHALETALLVRQLRPDVRLAVQLSNAAVGRAVADVTGPGSVIDVAALAAPSVVEACLRRRTHPIALAGEEFLAAEVTATADGTLRELYGDLAPIAVVPTAPSHPTLPAKRTTPPEASTPATASTAPMPPAAPTAPAAPAAATAPAAPGVATAPAAAGVATAPAAPGVATAPVAIGVATALAAPGVAAAAGAPGVAMDVCPGRDHRVRAGDRITVLGTRADFAARDLPLHAGHRRGPSGRGRRRRAVAKLWTFVHTMFRETDRALRFTLTALLTLMVVSVCVLLVGYRKPDGTHMSLLDALYFTVETVGTIGYGDFSFAAQDDWLRAYAVGFMITGAMLAAVSFALLTNLLISKRIAESLGRRDVGARAGHVIVVGLGAVGVRVVEGLLAEGREVVVVDRDENNRYLAQARALKVPVVVADATLRQTLQAVNLSSAAAVAVLTSDDLVNIETGLAVRDQLGERWTSVPVVLRLFDRQLAATVERSFGFQHVRSTAALAAPWFVGAALGLDVLGTFYVEHQPFLIAALSVAPGGGLDGLAMQDLSARTRVIAISRDNGVLEHPPRSGTRFGAGDRAYLVGPYEELLQVLRRDALSPTQIQ